MNKIRQAAATVVFWTTWPGLWLILRWSTRTRLLIICGDDFLVLQGWLSIGDWGLPGGGLHRREPIVTGLLREVREETGIVLAQDKVMPAFVGIARDKGIQFKYHAFYVVLPKRPTIKKQVREISAFAWQPINNPTLRLNNDTRAILGWWLNNR
ncbi:MAG TPA: NUDIX hydrolase [Candidatus Limnocylindrales bacterium]|nr:NUDIX hydrolase [Candidatus Limnocylindrales bacterium]